MPQKNKFPTILWNLIVLAFLAGGILALVFFSLPYANARALANHLSRDNNLQSLTETRFADLRLPMLAIGLVLLAVAVAFLALRKRSQAWVTDGLQVLAEMKVVSKRVRTSRASILVPQRRLRLLCADGLFLTLPFWEVYEITGVTIRLV